MTHRNRLGLALLCIASLSFLPSSSLSQQAAPSPDQVQIAEVTVRMSDHGPVVLLQAEHRILPIFVDVTVAISIQGALNGERLARPLSHDLMHTILDAYGARVVRTVISRKAETYFGALTVAMKEEVKTFDSRSSDSIALAIHFKAPIFVGRDLFESAGHVPEKQKGAEL
jgi:bifunctional DNase/RNase